MTVRRHLTALPKGSAFPVDTSDLPDGYPFLLAGVLYQWDDANSEWDLVAGGGGALPTYDHLPYRYVQVVDGSSATAFESGLRGGGPGTVSLATGLPEPFASYADNARTMTGPTLGNPDFIEFRAPHQIATDEWYDDFQAQTERTTMKCRVLYRYVIGTHGVAKFQDVDITNENSVTDRLTLTDTAGAYVWSTPFDLGLHSCGRWALRAESTISSGGGTPPSLGIVAFEVWEEPAVTELLELDGQQVRVDRSHNGVPPLSPITGRGANDGVWTFNYPTRGGGGERGGGWRSDEVRRPYFASVGNFAYEDADLQFEPVSNVTIKPMVPVDNGNEDHRSGDIVIGVDVANGPVFYGPAGDYEVSAEAYITGLVPGDVVSWYHYDGELGDYGREQTTVVGPGATEVYSGTRSAVVQGVGGQRLPALMVLTAAPSPVVTDFGYGVKCVGTREPIWFDTGAARPALVDAAAAADGTGQTVVTWTARETCRAGDNLIEIVATRLDGAFSAASAFADSDDGTATVTGLTPGRHVVHIQPTNQHDSVPPQYVGTVTVS